MVTQGNVSDGTFFAYCTDRCYYCRLVLHPPDNQRHYMWRAVSTLCNYRCSNPLCRRIDIELAHY